MKEVAVERDEAVLTYTMPMPPTGTNKRVTSVLPIMQSGDPDRIRTGDLCLDRAVCSAATPRGRNGACGQGACAALPKGNTSPGAGRGLVGGNGFEPMTSAMSTQRSKPLS